MIKGRGRGREGWDGVNPPKTNPVYGPSFVPSFEMVDSMFFALRGAGNCRFL
jgi:hypothetical protein